MRNAFLIILYILGFTFIANSQTIPSYVPINDLVGWWPFNGNSNDESGNGYHGTVNGANLTSDRFDLLGNSYYFNNAYINIQNPLDTLITDFSISLWFQRDSNQGGIIIAKKPSGAWKEGRWMINAYDTVYSFCLPNLFLSGCSSYNQTLDLNWHHFALIHDSNSDKIYIDNIQIDSTASSAVVQENADIRIGGREDINNDPFEGKIDDIGIWNRRLTNSEIENLYKSCSGSIIDSPRDTTVSLGTSASFSVSTNFVNVSYQWQADTGNGFLDLSNSGQFNGVNSENLIVSNITLTNDSTLFRCIVAEHNLCIDTTFIAKLNVFNVTGSEEKFLDKIKIYPNPASNNLQIENFSVFEIQFIIRDQLLRKVREESLKSGTRKKLPIRTLKKGIYFIEFYSNNFYTTKKLIIH